MNISYELTKDDYIEFNLFHLKHSKTIRKTLFVQRYIVSVLFLIMPFITYRFSEIPLTYWVSVFIIVYLLWVVYYPKYFRKSVKRRILRMIEEGKNESILGSKRLDVNSEGIVEKSRNNEVKTNWDSIESIEETEKYIFIYVSAVSAYIVPKRAFKTPADNENFINTVNSYLLRN